MATQNYPGERQFGITGGGTSFGEETMEDAASPSRKAETRQKADELAHKAGHTAKEQIGKQKANAVGRLSHISGALRSTSDHLRHEDESSIAKFVDGAARQVDQFVGYLDQRTADDILQDTRQLARRDPALFLGGAALLGLLGARFLRSSDRHEYR